MKKALKTALFVFIGGLAGLALSQAVPVPFVGDFNGLVSDGGLTVFGPTIVNGTLTADAGSIHVAQADTVNAGAVNVSGLTVLGGGLQVDGGIQLSGNGVDTPGPTLNVCAFGRICSNGSAFELDSAADEVTAGGIYLGGGAQVVIQSDGGTSALCAPGGNCVTTQKLLDWVLDAGGAGLL
jgi:hypothetical protein